MLLLIHSVSYSQSDTLCLTKDQAVSLANELDSLRMNLRECKIQYSYADRLVFDLINENVNLIEKDKLMTENNKELDSLVNIQDDLILKKDTEIKKHKKRFKILGISSGSAITLLLLVLLL